MDILNKLFKFKKTDSIKNLNTIIEDKDATIKTLRSRIRYLHSKILKLNKELDDFKFKISNGLMFEVPFKNWTEIYWIADSASNRNINDWIVCINNKYDIAIVKLTIEQYIIYESFVGMKFKEISDKITCTFAISCKEVGKTIFDNYNTALKKFNELTKED